MFQSIHKRLSSVCFVGVFCVLSLPIGCSPRTAPMSDAGKAKELLQTMLEDWKSGGNLEETKKRTPPVYVTEDLWRGGAKLDSYKVSDVSEVLGSNIRIKVNLKCTNKSGKAIDHSFRYIITTEPALTVVREEG